MDDTLIVDRLSQYVYARFRTERNRHQFPRGKYRAELHAISTAEYAAESMLRLCVGDVLAGGLASLAWERGRQQEEDNWQETLRQRAMNGA